MDVSPLCFHAELLWRQGVWDRRQDWGQENSWELLGLGGALLEWGLFWLFDNSCKLAWSWTPEELKCVLMCWGTWGQIQWLPYFPHHPECVSGIILCWGGKSRQRELETKDCWKNRQFFRGTEKLTNVAE